MTPDQRRANEATVRGLREALEHNLPADMRQGIQASIAHLTGRPDPTPEPPPTLGPAFTATVTFNGKTFPHPSIPNPRRPF
jgi:hypothetical protein